METWILENPNSSPRMGESGKQSVYLFNGAGNGVQVTSFGFYGGPGLPEL